jgi:hypothetical protein
MVRLVLLVQVSIEVLVVLGVSPPLFIRWRDTVKTRVIELSEQSRLSELNELSESS